MKTKTKMHTHTPGPWSVSMGFAGKVAGADGEYICEVFTTTYGKAVRNANERLIAAAPDLLEAAKLLDSCYDKNGAQIALTSDLRVCWERLGAAITKAEGDQ